MGTEDFKALFDKVADGPGICVQRASGKALVCAVEEDKKVPGLADFCNLSPLLSGGVDPSGVVGAGVQDDNGSGRCLSQIFHHAREVKSSGLSVPVAVLTEVGIAGPPKDEAMVAPGGVGVVDRVSAENPVEEVGANSQSAGATQRLEDGYIIGFKTKSCWSSEKVTYW